MNQHLTKVEDHPLMEQAQDVCVELDLDLVRRSAELRD